MPGARQQVMAARDPSIATTRVRATPG